jgi:hypothetical protein
MRTMQKWKIQPEQWNYLTLRQQQRMYRTGFSLAGKLMIGLVVSSLLLEAVFHL